MVLSPVIYWGIVRLQERCTEQMLVVDPLPDLQAREFSSWHPWAGSGAGEQRGIRGRAGQGDPACPC